MKSTITFFGGAGTVTGANFLLDTGTKKILIDCGLLQQEGGEGDNAAAFPYDPGQIDALIVTHAHADHIGRIPKLARDGYTGPIYSTPATRDLAAIMYDDALALMQAQEVRHRDAVLYEKEDATRALSLWKTCEYHEAFDIGDVKGELADAGHILGSASVRFSRGDKSIVFSGDVGNSPEPLLCDVEPPRGASYLVVDSVYGDRVHEGRDERRETLRAAIEDTRLRAGVLLIPSFSIERTQVLLSEMNSMVEEGIMQPIPVYLDSPLATRVTEVFRRYTSLFNTGAQGRIKKGDDPFSFPGLHLVAHAGDSRALHEKSGPMVIIAGAGMSGGGRIRAHERAFLPEKNATILFVGYQTPGTLGRRIQDGEKKVVIDGEHIRVRASLAQLSGYSGHADRDQLLAYVEASGEPLKKVFVTMGEARSSLFFAQRVKDFLGVEAIVPELGETYEIEL